MEDPFLVEPSIFLHSLPRCWSFNQAHKKPASLITKMLKSIMHKASKHVTNVLRYLLFFFLAFFFVAFFFAVFFLVTFFFTFFFAFFFAIIYPFQLIESFYVWLNMTILNSLIENLSIKLLKKLIKTVIFFIVQMFKNT